MAPATWRSRVAESESLLSASQSSYSSRRGFGRLEQAELVDRHLEEIALVARDGGPLLRILERRRDGRDLRPVLRADRVRVGAERLGLGLVEVVASAGREEDETRAHGCERAPHLPARGSLPAAQRVASKTSVVTALVLQAASRAETTYVTVIGLPGLPFVFATETMYAPEPSAVAV